MRQPDSLFDRACNFINTNPIGTTFRSSQYIQRVGFYEKSTAWKRSNQNPHYSSHLYKSELKKAGFISKVSYGVWGVDRHIPAWFSSGHLKVVNGFTTVFQGMDRTDIIAQLDHDAHHPNGVRPNVDNKKGLPKLRTVNYETYQKFIWLVKDLGIKSFRTQNELAAFIEDLKWPGVGNDGSKPTYAIQGNYQPIIDHLMADGFLTRKQYTGRLEYIVHITEGSQPIAQAKETRAKKAAMNSTYGSIGIDISSRSIGSPEPAKTSTKDSLLGRLHNMESALVELTIQVQMLIHNIENTSI